MQVRQVLILAMAATLLAGCETEREMVTGRENMLIAAGFTARPADTPQRQTELKTLAPHKFAYQQRSGKTVYVYPDPTVCDCLYIGDEQAYQKYHQLALQKQIADEQLQAAQMNQQNFDWGPWGPGWW